MPPPPSPEPAATELAAEAADYSGKSNLALSFLVLPKDRRRDMDVFYTFCRVVDDIADSPALPIETKRAWLDGWRKNILRPDDDPQPTRLAMQVRELMQRYSLPPAHFLEIIAGVEMDLEPVRYETWEALRQYCHRVASVVGLVSIEIFGCRHDLPACRAYAIDLGLALQITNILRDVATDYANGGRIYLPRDEMARFGVTEEDIARGRETPGFLDLMRFEAERAEEFYRSAIAARPAADRPALVASEIMREVYHRILEDIRAGGYRVLSRNFRLSKPRKLWAVVTGWWRHRRAVRRDRQAAAGSSGVGTKG